MYRRQKLTINGIAQWIAFKSMQDLVDKVTEMVQTQSNVKIIYFGDYMENWFKVFKEPKLEENTAKGYRCLMNNQIHPYIGSKSLNDITPEDVQNILNRQKSASQGKKIRSIISMVIDAAIIDEKYTHPNPTRDKRISLPSGKVKRQPLSSDELAQVLNHLPQLSPECAQILAMLIMTGCRRSEALGACWEDINWNSLTIHLQRVVRFRNNAAEVSTKMKTISANRIVSLWDSLLPYLGTPKTQGFIINSDGHPLTERKYTIRWKRAMRELNALGFLTTFTAHQLRHTYATIAANSGTVPLKVLQGILGHANFQTTMNTYADFDADKMRESSRDLGAKYAEIRRKSCSEGTYPKTLKSPAAQGFPGLEIS